MLAVQRGQIPGLSLFSALCRTTKDMHHIAFDAECDARLLDFVRTHLLSHCLLQLESELAAIDRYMGSLGVQLGGAGSVGPGTEALTTRGLVAMQVMAQSLASWQRSRDS